jgi:hypothetical protein
VRPVTDILLGMVDESGEALPGPVAYILHKAHHEAICPWCTDSLGAVVMPNGATYRELYSQLYNKQALHMLTCRERNATEMKVMVAK